MLDRRFVYAVSTARYGSFTTAAAHLGISQSAITRRIADLEQELGFAIFNRTARGVILTEEGRAFVDRASRLLEEAQDLMRGSSAKSDAFAGVLRIGICPASLEWLLIEPLELLTTRHPNIRLNVSGGSSETIVQQLRAGAIDVAIGHQGTFDEQPDLRHELLATMQTTFFARRGHPILDCPEVTKEEIAKYDMILPTVPVVFNYLWRTLYQDPTTDMQDRLHIIDYFPIITRLVRKTDALSVVAVDHARSEGFNRHFATVHFREMLPPSPLCSATRLRWTPRPAVRAFIKACRERLPSASPAPAID